MRMSRARRRCNLVVADYIERVLDATGWSQAELARQLEVPESRINVLRHGKPRRGHYGVDYQSVAVPFLFEIEEVSGVHLKIAAEPRPPLKPTLRLVNPN